jgi:hypothetical protein
MTQPHFDAGNIKLIAKNLAKELEKMKFNISHSASLNLTSRAFGYKDYNTYKAMKHADDKPTKKVIGSISFSELEKKLEKEKSELYPPLNDIFLLNEEEKTQEYDILISKEDDSPFLLFRLKSSSTGRVFYVPKYDIFSLYVYPDIKNAYNSYDVPIESAKNAHIENEYFSIIKHIIETKKWIAEDLNIIHDLLSLMEAIKNERNFLKKINNKYSAESLDSLWNANKVL